MDGSDLAVAYQNRWYETGATEDADRAIGHWHAVLAQSPGDDWAATNCGRLLVERARRTSSLADAAAAVRLLEFGATVAAGDPVAAERWYSLGVALRARWQLGQDRADIDAALRHLDTAATGARTDDDRVRIFLERILVAPSGHHQPRGAAVGGPEELEALEPVLVVDGARSRREAAPQFVAGVLRDRDRVDLDDLRHVTALP